MAGLENLFAAEPTLPNVQKTKLPENPDKWAEAITTQVREMYPDVATLPITIEFRKRDEQTGTAVGAVHIVSLEAEKAAFIPFVIERFQMCPMDVWMEPKTQKVHPLKKDTFKELFFTTKSNVDARPSDSTGTYFNDPSLWTTNYPPLQGRYSYASAGYPMLDAISDSFLESDLENMRNALREEPHLLPKLAAKGHKDIMKVLLGLKGRPMTNDFAASAANLIPTSIVDVRKEGPNKYTILSAQEDIFDLSSSKELSRNECERFLSKIVAKPQDFMNEVDTIGEKMVVMKPAPKEGVWLFDPKETKAESANEFTCYWVKNKNGLLIDALVIPHVVDISGNRVGGKMVLSKTHSCYQQSVAGVKYPESDCFTYVLKPSAIRTGQTGCFVYLGENGKAIATTPMTIIAVDTYGENLSVRDLVRARTVNVKRGYGNAFKFESRDEGKTDIHPNDTTISKVKTLESMGFAELKKDFFIIPSKMMWIPMQPMTELISSPDEWMVKEAMDRGLEVNPLEVRYTGVVYDVRGGGWPRGEMSERELKVALANEGASEEMIEKVKKKSKYEGKCCVHGTKKAKSKEDFKKEASPRFELVKKAAEVLKRNLVKIAADIDDKATVDTILSLNFLNAENLAKFVAYKDAFDKCADYMAELTLAARLGLKDIPEAAAVSAMNNLVEVSEGLERLSLSMKRPATKTASELSMKAPRKETPEEKKKREQAEQSSLGA